MHNKKRLAIYRPETLHPIAKKEGWQEGRPIYRDNVPLHKKKTTDHPEATPGWNLH